VRLIWNMSEILHFPHLGLKDLHDDLKGPSQRGTCTADFAVACSHIS
jgi:hypothetical protein